MSYTYDLSPEASFEDRYSQFIAFGIPKADVDALRATIKDMWADAPGGWPYEWSVFARKYLDAGNPQLAAVASAYIRMSLVAVLTFVASRGAVLQDGNRALRSDFGSLFPNSIK